MVWCSWEERREECVTSRKAHSWNHQGLARGLQQGKVALYAGAGVTCTPALTCSGALRSLFTLLQVERVTPKAAPSEKEAKVTK